MKLKTVFLILATVAIASCKNNKPIESTSTGKGTPVPTTNTQPTPPDASTTAPPNSPEVNKQIELDKLTGLLTHGVITQEEHDKLMAKITNGTYQYNPST